MKNIVEFPDSKKIEKEAVDWLIKLDGDTRPTPEELAALKEWMGRSPAHILELEKVNAFWGNLSVLTELNIPMVKPALLAQGKGLAEESINKGSVKQEASANDERLTKINDVGQESNNVQDASLARKQSPAFTWAKVASVLGVALLLQQLMLPGWFGANQFDSTNGHYAASIGKQSTIVLADGSSVHLNTNSQIQVDYTDGYRNIHLIQGEAHFDVAENKAKPFRVYAGKGRVQAVGTSFTVYLNEKDIEVLVTEGKVALAAQKTVHVTDASLNAKPKSVSERSVAANSMEFDDPHYYLTIPVEQLGLLVEGQGATILVAQDNQFDNALENQPTLRKVELMDAQSIERRDAWRQGLLLFAGDSLEDVVAEISRYTTMSIEIVDPSLKKIRIGGQFRVGDIDGMFDVLEANFGLSITLLDNHHVQISAANK